MKIIPWSAPQITTKDKITINKAINSTWISDGKYIKKFEKKFSSYIKCPRSLTTNNGTSAISLVYQTLNLKNNDEIILPSYGYLAAANLALQNGYKIKFVDVASSTMISKLNYVR